MYQNSKQQLFLPKYQPSNKVNDMKTFILTIIVLFGLGLQSTNAIDIKKCIVKHSHSFPQEKIFVHTDRDVYVAGDTIWFRAFLVDAMTRLERTDSRFVNVALYDTNMKLVERHLIKADSVTNVFANAIKLANNLKTGSYTIMAYTEWMRNFSNQRFFYKHITVADQETKDFDSMMSGDASTGMAASIYDAGKKDNDIIVSQRRGRLHIQYVPFNKDSLDYRDYGIAIYGNGNLFAIDTLKSKYCVIKQDEFLSGAVNIAIVDNRTGQVMSERLAYINGGDKTQVSIKKNEPLEDKESNGHGAPFTLDIDVKNIVKKPLTGNFSISVTDADLVKKDSTQQNLASYLLAGSELSPMRSDFIDLFSNINNRNIGKLNAILGANTSPMRYDMNMMLGQKAPINVKFNIQRKLYITGSIQGTIFKKLNKPILYVHQNGVPYTPESYEEEKHQLASNTNFRITGDFTEGLEFVLDGTKQSGSHSCVEVKVDETTYPEPGVSASAMNYSLLHKTFIKYEHLHAVINGLYQMNFLEEVEVKGRRVLSNDLEGRKCKTMQELFARKGLANRYRHYFVNGKAVAYATVMSMDPSRILYIREHLDIFYPPTNIYNNYRRPSGQEVVDRLKEENDWVKRWNVESNEDNTDLWIATLDYFGEKNMPVFVESVYNEPLAIKIVRPQGYKLDVSADAFNHPAEYGKLDPRITIYWSPYVKLSEDGKAKITVYPSDTSKKYRVTIQGIASDGSIINKEIEL